MDSRRDPTTIGTDEFGNPVLQYYTCENGHCMEIYDLKCERRCNELVFDMKDKNSVIVDRERIIIAECSRRQTAETSRLVTVRYITLDLRYGYFLLHLLIFPAPEWKRYLVCGLFQRYH